RASTSWSCGARSGSAASQRAPSGADGRFFGWPAVTRATGTGVPGTRWIAGVDSRPAGVLGAVELFVGRSAEVLEIQAVNQQLGDARAEGDAKTAPLVVDKGLGLHAIEHILHPPHAVGARHPVHPDQELFAAPAGDDVVAAEGADQQLAQPAQHGVANGMAVLIVDLLKMIDVEHRD